MSKLLLCSFKHTFMRRAHFFTVLCVLLILKVLCGVVALCFVLHSLRFSIAWFRSVYGCFMFFLYHTRSFVQTGWCFFSFLRLCVDWWRHYRLHSIIFGFVLFWGSNKPHLHTILPQWKENFIGYPMARNELFEFGLYFLSRFFTFHFVPFLFVSLLLISTHTHTHNPMADVSSMYRAFSSRDRSINTPIIQMLFTCGVCVVFIEYAICTNPIRMAVKIFNINSYAASKTALNQILKSQINMVCFVVRLSIVAVEKVCAWAPSTRSPRKSHSTYTTHTHTHNLSRSGLHRR